MSKLRITLRLRTSLFLKLKHMTLKRILFTQLLLLGALLLYVPMHAQDIHYTQFHNAAFTISPGLTGVFKEDARFMANYRKQWPSVVDYVTYSAAADVKLWPYGPKRNGFFAAGLSINRDQAGVAKLTLVNVGLNGSYTHRLSDFAFLSVGLQGAFNQRKFNIDNLSFNEQYDPDNGYDPALSNGETKFNSTNSFFSLGAGINIRIQALSEQKLVDELKHRSKIDIGLGFNNLNRPDQSFENSDPVRLPLRFSPYILSIIQLGEDSDWDLAANAFMQTQQKYREAVLMGGVKYHFNRTPGSQTSLQLSGAYRFFNNRDAIAPVLELSYNEWNFGFSWDINLSGFKAATNSNGGPELSIRYGLSKPNLTHPRICRLL